MKKKFMALLILSIVAFSGCSAAEPPYAPEAPPPPAADAAPEAAGEYPGSEFSLPRSEDTEWFYSMDDTNGEAYLEINENPERSTAEESMLTFSLKVDTAAYSNVERYIIESGSLPPADAVRTEEMINYFDYDAPMDFGDDPFSIYTEIGASPFDPNKQLAFIRVKSKDMDKSELPDSNLTFLIDTSGSMDSYDKLPLLKEAFGLLVETLGENDRVSIVTYAGSSDVVLDSESGANDSRILNAIDDLRAGGSTAGANGILTAYELAEKNFVEGGNNRVILASDGDFNVGISDVNELERLIAQKRDSGVYLSILGFGTGNIRDDIMETLAANGNGNYSYINSEATANKVLVEELSTNLFTIADDVKAQVEFNPNTIESYRLIGYENRQLENRDFEDDTKDAGEIGIGTDVVVLFELTLKDDDAYKYSKTEEDPAADFSGELFEVRLRYKNPGEEESNLMLAPVLTADITENTSDDFRFASAVAAFGHLLRNSEYAENLTAADVIDLAAESIGYDEKGYRRDFIDLLKIYHSQYRTTAD